jgi:hypothetical protein
MELCVSCAPVIEKVMTMSDVEWVYKHETVMKVAARTFDGEVSCQDGGRSPRGTRCLQ